ncbi:MAG: histidinol-phosphatase [Muribaculum sp.]|nr:histidinol-phosphatase [Muribaculaceae bacterium]MCM1080603.1 histidinol-phosphatase [Muribaculum sp.]
MAKIDLKSIISSTDRYNFHSHTQFCDGRASMEQIVTAAIEEGFEHWGFSPHSPIPFSSSCNMTTESVTSYLNEIERLRQKFGQQINLYAAMEVDFLGSQWGAHSSYFQDLNLDYLISSVHFIQTKNGTWVDIDGKPESFCKKMVTFFDGDIRRVVEEYFAQSIMMLQLGGFDITGHIDKIGNNASAFHPGIEEEQWYITMRNNLVQAAIESGVAVEYNTKAQRPSPQVITKLVEANVVIPVNSDAHTPENVNLLRNEKIHYINSLICQ